MTKSKRIPLSLDDDRRTAYEAAASKAGITLSAWICEQCDAALPKRTAAKLSERKGRGRPKN